MDSTRLSAADYLPRTFYAVALLFHHPDGVYKPVLHHFGVSGQNPLTEAEAVARSVRETEASWDSQHEIESPPFAAHALVSALVSSLIVKRVS